MKETLKEGASVTRTFTIDKGRTISHLGEDLRVYATPDLVRDIEHTCLDFIAEHADEGEHSVGTAIELRHLAPTPLGMDVEITATVEKVEGRAVSFDVVARDAIDEIARCKHGRFVVLIDKVKQRVAAKKAQAAKG